ncbi:hypothetical protein [Paraburkholderia dinghuensis]|uniref:Uncharacterized protein n=1 Tax=Paraburkholderia dinghuensis TaxID=2305225 RepID=A0A3N6MHT1_9BURK|nr:hypothetical protein [Paraburkholderia dinghuensis]RQH02738.1 hypothetical protein D1Y85_21635 [Paraburkholderia dinghuensis]
MQLTKEEWLELTRREHADAIAEGVLAVDDDAEVRTVELLDLPGAAAEWVQVWVRVQTTQGERHEPAR